MELLDKKTLDSLNEKLAVIEQSPGQSGPVEMILARPSKDKREMLQQCELNTETGLIGDNWIDRGDKHTADGKSDPARQITLMNCRSIAAIAGAKKENWQGAGDQFFVDFDLSDANLSAGSRFRLGSAILEVTVAPHLGCRKFSARFGKDATLFVNSKKGRALNLRGINARIIKSGTVAVGDRISKLD